MREIKFRAWDKDNKVMHFSNENEDDIVWEITPLIKFLEMRTIDSFPGGEYHLQEDAWVAPNQTLMQYTGLKDKNSKEIYESDIVNIDGLIVPVIWYAGAWMVEYFTIPTKSYLSHFDELDVEIIGNIYENPDLLS